MPYVFQVQAANLVQRHGQRIANAAHHALHRLADGSPLEKSGLHDVAVFGDFLQRGNQGVVVVLTVQLAILEDPRFHANDLAVLVGGLAHHHAEILDRAMLLAEGVISLVQRCQALFPRTIIELVEARGLHLVAQPHIALEPGLLLLAQADHARQGLANALVDPHQRAILAHVDNALALHGGVEINGLGLGSGLRLRLRGIGSGRQILDRRRELGIQLGGRFVVGDYGVFLAAHAVAVDAPAFIVHIAADALLPQYHVRVRGEVFVDHHGAVRGLHRGHIGPCVPARRFARGALLEENNVRHHAGAGVALECRGWQADRAQQVGAFGQVLARLVTLLVHRALAGHEHLDASGAHQVDALGKEEVMQHEPLLRVLGVAVDFGLRERRVAHVHVKEVLREFALDEVAMNHVLLG